VWLAAASAAALAVAPLLVLPSLVRQRVASVVDERFGLRATIESVGFSWSGIGLSGLRLVAADESAVQLDAAEVQLELGWMAALVSGSAAVTGVSASGIDAEVDVASAAYKSLRDRLRAAPASGNAPRAHRTLLATRFSLTVREGKQELLTIDGTEANLGQTEITASVSRLRASKPGLASAALSGVELKAVRGDGVRLRELLVNEAMLSITAPVPDTSAAVDPVAADDDDNAADGTAAAAGKAPSAVPPTAAHPIGTDRRASLQALLTKFTPDAVMRLDRARIEQVSGNTRVPILSDVACQLKVLPDGAVRVTGKGSTEAGGKLDVDMRIWPADLRADGRVTLSALPLTLLVPFLPSVPWFEPEKSRIDAALLIKAESPARVALEGHADLRAVSLSAERIASVPVRGISISIAGRGHWLPIERRLEIETGSFGLGKARAAVKGAVELAADHYAFDIDANLPPTPCTEAVRSIPNDLLGDMALTQFRGTIAAKLRFQTDSRDLDKTQLSVDMTDHCDFVAVPIIADLSRFARPFTHSVTEPDGATFEMETGPGTANWTPIEAMSPYFVHAVLVHEDPGFFTHHGFSLINIRNALVRDLRERRYAVGASTITMQLVKNVFLHREKTLARKIQEVLLTWWTERVMEKRDIIELYLNVIEYGPSVYGIRSAAKHYWNRLPAELSPAESVYLATILPNPKHFHTYYQRNALSASWASNMRKMLQRLAERGNYDKAAFDYGMQELEHFHFARDGAPALPRSIPGVTSPLPYEEERIESFDVNTFGRPTGFD
jgi:hypothetical protein